MPAIAMAGEIAYRVRWNVVVTIVLSKIYDAVEKVCRGEVGVSGCGVAPGWMSMVRLAITTGAKRHRDKAHQTMTTSPLQYSTMPPSEPPQDVPLEPISSQPIPSQPMSIESVKAQGEGKALRLRGGCIPCPVWTLALLLAIQLTVVHSGWHLLDNTNSSLLLKCSAGT